MLRSIQLLRAAAAMGVVVQHADRFGLLGDSARKGAAGVDLFFVISGFIMATIASDRAPGRFLADRVWRIFPLWLIALLPWLFVRVEGWQSVATSLTLWPVWCNATYMPALYVGWSLCFEMLFYAAFALALARRAYIPLGLFALSFVAAPFLNSALADYVGSPLIFEFLAGVAIARMPFREGMGLPLLLAGLAWLALAPTGYAGLVFGHDAMPRLIGWGIPAALIVYGTRCLERRIGRLFDFPLLLGDASYSIYLFHPLVVGMGSSFATAVALSLTAGLAGHFAIERPLIALRRHFRSPRQRPEPAAAG